MNRKFNILLFIVSMFILASILLGMKFLHVESLSAQIPIKTKINAPRIQKNNLEIPESLLAEKNKLFVI